VVLLLSQFLFIVFIISDLGLDLRTIVIDFGLANFKLVIVCRLRFAQALVQFFWVSLDFRLYFI